MIFGEYEFVIMMAIGASRDCITFETINLSDISAFSLVQWEKTDLITLKIIL